MTKTTEAFWVDWLGGSVKVKGTEPVGLLGVLSNSTGKFASGQASYRSSRSVGDSHEYLDRIWASARLDSQSDCCSRGARKEMRPPGAALPEASVSVVLPLWCGHENKVAEMVRA